MVKRLTSCRFLLRAGTWKKMSGVTECTEHTTKSYRNSSSTGQDILWSTAQNASKSDETTTTSKGSENCERETDVYGKQECEFGKLKENSGKEGEMEGSPSPKLYNKNETKNEKKETVKKPPPAAVVIDDDSSSPKIWLTLQNVCPDDPESRLTILEATKNNIWTKMDGFMTQKSMPAKSFLRNNFLWLMAFVILL